MKNRSALKTLVMGPVSAGFALTTGLLLAFPSSRTIADALWAFIIGVLGGLLIFGPIAAALAFGPRVRPWTVAHGYSVQWYSSTLMMLSLGYLLASVVHRTSDLLTGLAVLILFFGVLAKIVFAIIFRTGNEPPSNGKRPRPPRAPVLRPPGGRPPVLRAAELIPEA